MADLKVLRGSIEGMANDLFVIAGIPFEKTTELQRQLFASFAFGMTFAVGQLEKLTPPEVHALAIGVLMDSFKYSDGQATAFAQHLIDSASGGGNPTIRAIIHRGIDGHRQWQANQKAELRANIESMLNAVGA